MKHIVPVTTLDNDERAAISVVLISIINNNLRTVLYKQGVIVYPLVQILCHCRCFSIGTINHGVADLWNISSPGHSCLCVQTVRQLRRREEDQCVEHNI